MNHMQMVPPSGGDPFGLAVVIIGAILAATMFVLAVRATFWPGEIAPDHPKRSILRPDR